MRTLIHNEGYFTTTTEAVPRTVHKFFQTFAPITKTTTSTTTTTTTTPLPTTLITETTTKAWRAITKAATVPTTTIRNDFDFDFYLAKGVLDWYTNAFRFGCCSSSNFSL